MNTRNNIIHTVTLFSSVGTLVCCTLPALFVSLGAGAALIGLLNAVPQLVWLSEHKIAIFVFAAVMLLASGVMRYLNRNAPCPADPNQAEACNRLRRISSIIFYCSVFIYVTGFFFAFIASHLFG